MEKIKIALLVTVIAFFLVLFSALIYTNTTAPECQDIRVGTITNVDVRDSWMGTSNVIITLSNGHIIDTYVGTNELKVSGTLYDDCRGGYSIK